MSFEAKGSLRLRFAAGVSIVSLAVAASSAWAQDARAPGSQQGTAADEIEEIVVTGSRIRRSGYDTVQPTTVVSAVTIEQRAANSIGEVLNELPGFGVPGQTPIGASNSGGRVTTGQSFVNFFGLGSQRSLTLVNGMRFPGANNPSANSRSPGQQVDLNMIPTALIDRVETIAVGGAPIYGADAIAGTINIILKKRFVGFDATVTGGTTDHGDASKYRAQALYGFDFADGRGNIVFNGEYNYQGGLREADRADTAAAWSFESAAPGVDSPFNNNATRDTRINATSPDGIILTSRNLALDGGGARDANGNYLRFSPSGEVMPYDVGIAIDPISSIGGEGLNLSEFTTLLARSERYMGNIFVNYEFNPSLRLHMEGWVSRTKSNSPAIQTDYNSITSQVAADRDGRPVFGPYVIRLDNPFLSDASRTILGQATDLDGNGVPDNILDLDGDGVGDTQGFYIDKANQSLEGYRPSYSNQTLLRAMASLEGDFMAGERKFSWSVSAAHGETKSDFSQIATVANRLHQAVDVVENLDGTIVCRDPSNGCVPLNVFSNTPDPAAVAFVTADVTSKTHIKQTVFSANITGGLLDLPGGELSFATGIDYRKESSSFQPDFLSRSGEARGFPRTPVSGSYESKEVYGETLIPIVGPSMGVPLINKLSVEGALRYVDNSLAGSDITWTAGGRWSPIADIELRGNYTRSIRAPAITELFLPSSTVLALVNDPCDTRFVASGTEPGRRAANCAAAGIAQPFSSDITNAAKPIDITGNPNLKNEEARSWTVGTIMTPRFIPGLVASVDWVNIKLRNSIESLNGTTLLNACYDSASFPTADVCGQFTRDAEGQITSISTGYINAGFINFEGLTANLSYGFDIGNSRLAISANYQYTSKLDFSVTGTDLTRRAGQIGNSKHRGTGSVTWTSGGLTVFGQGIYISSAAFDNSDSPNARDVRGVKAWTVFNGAIGYEINDNLELRMTVSNVFDNGAPKYATLSGDGISTYFAGLLGRSYAMSARLKF